MRKRNKFKVKVLKRGLPNKQKWYGSGSSAGVLDMDDIAKEALGDSTVAEEDFYAVLTLLKKYTKRKLKDGYSIKLFKIGTLYPRIKTTGVDNPKEFNKRNIESVSVGFRVDREFKDDIQNMQMEFIYPDETEEK